MKIQNVEVEGEQPSVLQVLQNGFSWSGGESDVTLHRQTTRKFNILNSKVWKLRRFSTW